MNQMTSDGTTKSVIAALHDPTSQSVGANLNLLTGGGYHDGYQWWQYPTYPSVWPTTIYAYPWPRAHECCFCIDYTPDGSKKLHAMCCHCRDWRLAAKEKK